MKKIKYLFFGIILSIVSEKMVAQDVAPTKKEESPKSYLSGKISYLTNSVYNGRKDSLTTPYFSPSITYNHKSGFYISTTINYLTASYANRVDNFSIDFGYDKQLTDNLGLSLSGYRAFYNQNIIAVSSESKGSFDAGLSYDIDFISLSASGGITISSPKNDYSFSASIEHGFEIGEDNNSWSITPAITMNMLTANSYESFLNTRKTKTGKGRRTQTVTETVTVENPQKLRVMDYEITMPIKYNAEKWGLFIKPIFAIPQNAIVITTKVGNTTQKVTEHIENTFYLEFGVNFKFK